jgi:hypothetical protein
MTACACWSSVSSASKKKRRDRGRYPRCLQRGEGCWLRREDHAPDHPLAQDEPDDRREMEAILDVYKNALGID